MHLCGIISMTYATVTESDDVQNSPLPPTDFFVWTTNRFRPIIEFRMYHDSSAMSSSLGVGTMGGEEWCPTTGEDDYRLELSSLLLHQGQEHSTSSKLRWNRVHQGLYENELTKWSNFPTSQL